MKQKKRPNVPNSLFSSGAGEVSSQAQDNFHGVQDAPPGTPGTSAGGTGRCHWFSLPFVNGLLLFFLLLAVAVACYAGYAYHLPAGASYTVELTVRYSDVQIFAARAGLTVEEALSFLKDRGITSVGVAEHTLWQLRRDPGCYVLSNLELAGELALNPEISPYRDFLETKAREAGFSFGDYLVFMPAGPWAEQVEEHLHVLYAVEGGELFRLTTHRREGMVLYLLQGAHYDHLPPLSLGAHPARLEQVATAGLLVNPYLSPRTIETPGTAEQMLAVYERYPLSAAVFEGGVVPCYPAELPGLAAALRARGIPAALYEYHRFPRGMKELAPLLDYRLVVMRPGNILDDPQAALNGLRERRVQLLELELRALASRSNGQALQEAVDARLTRLTAALQANGYTPGQALPRQPFQGRFLLYFIMAAGVGALALFLLQFFFPPRPSVLLGIFALGLVVTAVLFQTRFLFTQQALALLAAVLFPYYGALYLLVWPFAAARPVPDEQNSTGRHNKKAEPFFPGTGLLLHCLYRVFNLFLFSLAGGLLVHGLLTTPPFFHGLEFFRGVKAMYILPLVLSGLTALVLPVSFNNPGKDSAPQPKDYICRGSLFPLQLHAEQRQAFFASLRRILRRPLVLGDLLLLGLLLLGAYIYLTRTGHVRAIAPLESALRNFLDQKLGVRPRFKEFALGYPLALLGLYLAAALFGRSRAVYPAGFSGEGKGSGEPRFPSAGRTGEAEGPCSVDPSGVKGHCCQSQTGPSRKEGRESGSVKGHRCQSKTLLYLTFGALLGGVLAPVSVVNTFAHTLAPLGLSLLRSFHGFWLGCLGGLLLILCWEKIGGGRDDLQRRKSD